MIFTGISRVFSTVNSAQYADIGAFWDEMAEKYGRANLRGLGLNWTETSLEYVIGLIDGTAENADTTVELPDNGWITVCGRTEHLARIYDEIYADGALTFEIEMFDDNGNCRIMYYRKITI